MSKYIHNPYSLSSGAMTDSGIVHGLYIQQLLCTEEFSWIDTGPQDSIPIIIIHFLLPCFI